MCSVLVLGVQRCPLSLWILQELLKEQERVGREVEEEVEVRMRRAERDDEEQRQLLHDADTDLQVRHCLAAITAFRHRCRQRARNGNRRDDHFKTRCAVLQALEESLAEAGQLGLDRDWEREVGLRLERLEVDGDRKRDRLTERHAETLGQQDRLLDTVRDMQGWKVRGQGGGPN